MKLGYLRLRSDGAQAHNPNVPASDDDRMQFAQALGFTEFYTAEQDLHGVDATICASAIPPAAVHGSEDCPFLRVQRDLPIRPTPQLVAVDGEVQQDRAIAPSKLVVPVHTVQEVHAQAVLGLAPLSVSWVGTDMLARHWAAHVTGCTHVARCARSQNWRIARTVIANDDPVRAEALAKDPNSPCRAYYRARAPQGADDAAIDALIDDCVLYGTPATILDRLAHLMAATAAFGTLTLIDHDWPAPALARQSIALFAGAVLSTNQAQPRRKTRKLEHA